jgi:hypothetical protein
MSVTRKLVTVVEASSMLAPHLKPTNATNWLADHRRKKAHYRDRGVKPPTHVKHDGVWHYPIEEIERVRDELIAIKKSAGH